MNKNVEFLSAILILNLFVLPTWFIVKWQKILKKDIKNKVSLKNEIFIFIFIEYLVCLVSVTIVPLPFSKIGSPYLNLDAFHQTYNNFQSAMNHTSGRTVWNETENLLGNVILFFPFGFLLPIINNKFQNFFILFITALLSSFFIEAVQYFLSINWGYNRIADVDDLILNSIGSIVGYIFFKLWYHFSIRFTFIR